MSAAARGEVERDPVLSVLDRAAEQSGRDALLLALRPAWLLADAEHQLCMDILEVQEGHRDRRFPSGVLRMAKMIERKALDLRNRAAVDATNALAECIFALPARTLAGILFKREVLHNFGRGDRPPFENSLSDDLLAMMQERPPQASTSADSQTKAA